MVRKPMPARNPVIRPWRPEDRPALEALNAELQEHERALRPSRRPGLAVTAAYIAELVRRLGDDEAEGALLVAEEAGDVVGFLACFVGEDILEADRREVVIEDLVIAAGRRRQGIGRALIEAARDFARSRAIRRLVVSVLTVNDDAVAAYRTLGFRPAFLTLEQKVEAPDPDPLSPPP